VEQAIQAWIENGEVDWANEVILDKSFKDNEKLKCIHDKLKLNTNFYSNMLSKFSSETNNNLLFKSGTTPIGDWGITVGSQNNSNSFTIITNDNLETSSNLKKIITLSHELVHAYMYNSLENWGFINYNENGEPILDVHCQNGFDYNNLNLNNLSIKDRFVAIICAFNDNNTLTENWTHQLFGVWTFDVNTYQEKLKALLINENDWGNESDNFKNNAITTFGVNNWIEKVAEAVSWIGLEDTTEYQNYLNSYPNNSIQYFYISSINSQIITANKNCP